jgi:hypothetical protein
VTFDAARLTARFDERCVSHYREFAYEGIGAMLRAHEPGFFKLMSHTLGLIPFDAPDGPDPERFFARYLDQFPPHVQRLIAHGYGRIVTFSHVDVSAAIEFAVTLPRPRVEPVVHGIAFAFAMVNSAELPRLLRASAIPFPPTVRAAFQNGLIYALVFLDWFVPGFLAGWRPESALDAELTEHAVREVARARERGVLPAFQLSTPRE